MEHGLVLHEKYTFHATGFRTAWNAMCRNVYSDVLAGRAAVTFIAVFMLISGFVVFKVVNVSNLT